MNRVLALSEAVLPQDVLGVIAQKLSDQKLENGFLAAQALARSCQPLYNIIKKQILKDSLILESLKRYIFKRDRVRLSSLFIES